MAKTGECVVQLQTMTCVITPSCIRATNSERVSSNVEVINDTAGQKQQHCEWWMTDSSWRGRISLWENPLTSRFSQIREGSILLLFLAIIQLDSSANMGRPAVPHSSCWTSHTQNCMAHLFIQTTLLLLADVLKPLWPKEERFGLRLLNLGVFSSSENVNQLLTSHWFKLCKI